MRPGEEIKLMLFGPEMREEGGQLLIIHFDAKLCELANENV